MTNILGQLMETIDAAIVEGREISVCTEHGKNRIMSSFIPTEYDMEDGIYIAGENYLLNLDKEGCVMNYDPEEEEFLVKCDNVKYYLAII